MGDVSQYDAEPPSPDEGDTQPLHPSEPSYPPPYAHQPPPSQPPPSQPSQPPPSQPPYSQPPYSQPQYSQAQYPPPPRHAAPGPYAPPTTPYPTPYAQSQQRQKAHMPGWAWAVLVVLALVVGSIGGAITSAVVSSSIAGRNGNVPIIGADNGAPSPLKADNGSISAVAAKVLPSTVQVQANGGADGSPGGGATGSGFVLDDHDHVITNNHVVADATGPGQLKVVDSAGRKHDAKIVGRSPVYDIAVLAVSNPHGLRPAAIGSSSQLRVGDTVVAIGSPLGLSSTVTAGIVSATNRPVTTGNDTQSSYINAIQTDAAINPGNSGGPLVDTRGQVIGVNSAIATTGGAIGGEAGNIGVGFAIPMKQVQITASQILATGEARYPVIGASVNTGENNGAKISDVPAGTPASHAGLKQGDVVTSIDGRRVTDGIDLIVAIRSHQPGEVVDLSVQRGGKHEDVKIKLDSKVG
jgi:putative serine protease PepD